jgi:glycosyltransferase involved in cell wall biosynthesis
MSKIKIVRVVTASYVVPWHMANTLSRMAVDFDVCIVGQNVSSHQKKYPNIKYFDINISRKPTMINDLLALLAICRFFYSYKPDIVHSICPKAGLLAALAGSICRIPIRIHTFTGQVWADKSGFHKHIYYMLDKLVNFLNTVCLTDSPSQSAFLFENDISHLGKPLPVLLQGSLSGVDIDRFNLYNHDMSKNRLRTKLRIGEKDIIFTFIARKTKTKGAISILYAFSNVSRSFPEAKLLFIGPDEDKEIEILHTRNENLFNNVFDIGSVDNHEEYLAITNILCLPSYREGFGSIVIDAAAMGVPAIGSRIPGLIDAIVDQQTGLLFNAGDIETLTNLMILLIKDSQLRNKLGSQARERVVNYFTADRLYLALKDLYLNCAFRNPIITKRHDLI